MKKILTIILDGFGYREEENDNAIKAANMQNFNNLWHSYPHSLLKTGDENYQSFDSKCEINHMTIGAGRVLKKNSDIVNDFFENIDIDNKNVARLLKAQEKDIHIMGLCSDKAVDANINDFVNIYNLLVGNGFKKIHFHLITDGDHDVLKYINKIKELINEYKVGDIVSICGKCYAMDSSENWERTKIYYNLVVNGNGINALNIERAIQYNYENSINDDSIKPIITSNNLIKNGDVLIWMNYLDINSKQILNAFVNSDTFTKFNVNDMNDLEVYTLFFDDKKIKTYNLIDLLQVKNPLGLYLSTLGFTQARIAEEEKFKYITKYFDGGYDGKIDNCDKYNIPSQDVLSYDLMPEMSAVGVTKKVVEAMNNDYDFILANYANADLVGNTGNIEAATDACIALDLCLSRIVEKAEENFYKVIILSDHGNAEEMLNENEHHNSSINNNPVPFIICDNKIKLKEEGSLANVAPTILDYMDIAIPSEMGQTESLIERIIN